MRISSPNLVKNLVSKGTRLEGRDFLEYRNIKVELNPVDKAEGSCYVEMGDTKVIVGVKFGVMEPYPDTPNEGGLVVSLNYVPIVFQDLEKNIDIEFSRVIDRSIRESNMLNMEDFCVTKGEKAIQVFIDGYVLNYDGNLVDALNLAAVKALKNTKMPKIEKGEIVLTDQNIKLNHLPIMVTISSIEGNYMVDLNKTEEKAIDYSFIVSFLNENETCAMQKMGTGGIKSSELKKLMEIGKEKQKELRKFLFNSQFKKQITSQSNRTFPTMPALPRPNLSFI